MISPLLGLLNELLHTIRVWHRDNALHNWWQYKIILCTNAIAIILGQVSVSMQLNWGDCFVFLIV